LSLPSEILARRMRLARAYTHDVVCERDLRAEMDDGAVLLADRWVARAARGRPQPTVLIRSPYGRRQFVGLVFGRLLAERGFQVVIQSVRGTFGSAGEFSPFDERADGLATLRWLRVQPWHSGPIGMFGPSYLGLVQWAVAADAGEDLGALAVQVSASQFHGSTYPGGGMSLETTASWMVFVAFQESRLAPLVLARRMRTLPQALSKLPLRDLDEHVTGSQVAWYRTGLGRVSREDAYWAARDFTAGVAQVEARVQLIGGWYDILLPWMLEDFTALQDAGRAPQLIIGPWAHTAPALLAMSLRDGLGWLRAHLLKDDRMKPPAPVRVFVTGDRPHGGWRSLPRWPPPGMRQRRLWLAGGGRLLESEPAADGGGGPGGGPGDRYRYDPNDPTPSLGGPVLLAREPVVDNRPLEERPDVLVYTGEPLPAAYEAIGPVRVELWVRTSSPWFDLFARVCDVDAAGVSRNVCDALQRVDPGQLSPAGDGSWRVAFDLWPTARRFAAGHRIRLQVSSGAHPRYARNPGTGEDPLTGTRLEPVDVELLHDAEHPSVLILPA
jgi:putative CocE/NonD family hydrolase